MVHQKLPTRMIYVSGNDELEGIYCKIYEERLLNDVIEMSEQW